MSRASADFNYKVALASGLKSLQAGRLRQAEEQFRYLVAHFPASDGGYRGLAKVLIEQEDRPGALHALLEGGAVLAKSDARAGAIGLYREAVTLDPHDLTAHRRLAAALALAGESDEAAREYERFIGVATAAGDLARVDLEREYSLGSTTESPAPEAPAAREVPPGVASGTPAGSETVGDREALMRTAFGSAEPAPQPEPESVPTGAWEHAAAAPAAAPRPVELPPVEIAADVDALSVEATAATYLAQGDPRGGQAALEAARRYIADGRMDAASDLLLQLIASGIADHEAQRLLVDVTKSLGRRDVAKAKVELLVQALRLDGRNELAAEVEQLAQAF